MRSSTALSALLFVASPFVVGAIAATPLSAQQPAPLRAAPSGRATTEVTLSPPRVQGQPAPTAHTIRIDYGQPHARGRQVAGGLIPHGEIWRTGANTSTSFTTGVDLDIGGTVVPKGTYSLYTFATPTGMQLVINKQTGQWGTEYSQAQDLARIPLTVRKRSEPIESFTIWLVPDAQGAAGVLRMAWGDVEASARWQAR